MDNLFRVRYSRRADGVWQTSDVLTKEQSQQLADRLLDKGYIVRTIQITTTKGKASE